MKIIKIERKESTLNIYIASGEGLHMNDIHNETHNPIFKVLQKMNTR
jgi:hypothetical protein